MSKENREVLVHVDHMKKYFPVRKKGVLKAVDDVSFNIYKGETLGLVGESGCGKTTCGRTVLGLYPVTEGTVEYAGKNVTNLKKNDLNWFKKRAQMIFQDPYASLDPRMTVCLLYTSQSGYSLSEKRGCGSRIPADEVRAYSL